MKAVVICIVLLHVAVALAQLNVDAWQGTWSDGKRSAGGSTYICVDAQTSTAFGAYSGVGLFSGYLHGNTMTGFWYEAGYDRPFGPFELTISGNSFSGTWSYYQGEGMAPEGSFSWGGSKSSSTRPAPELCLAPVKGSNAGGTYEPGNYLCYTQNLPYSNTNQESTFGSFPNFGDVAGYTPDNGITFLMSDFYFPNKTQQEIYRPENSPSTFGPCTDCFDDDGEPPEDEIPTRRIVIGRLVSDRKFCGYFWEGLYNKLIGGGGAVCLERTSRNNPDPLLCGSDVTYINGQIDKRVSDGLTSFILSKVQSAFDALTLPPVVVVPGTASFFTTITNTIPSVTYNSPGESPTTYNYGTATGSASDASTLVVSALVTIVLVVF